MSNETTYELTEEQKKLLDDEINIHLEYNRKTDRIANKETIHEFVKMAYVDANVPGPDDIIIVKSPYAGIFVAALIEESFNVEKENNTTPEQVILQMLNSGKKIKDVKNPLLNSNISDFEQILKTIQTDSVNFVSEYLYSRLKDESVNFEDFKSIAWSYLRNTLLKMDKVKISSQIDKCAYGNHDSAWIAFYKFFQKELKIENLTSIDGIAELAKNAGWYWPFDEVAIVCDFPTEIHQDDRQRFHNPDGPAIGYCDGFGIYCYRNRRIDPDIINDHNKVTIDMIKKEENQEMKAILIELYTLEKYVQDANLKVLSYDKHNKATLYEDKIGDEKIKYVCLENHTPEPDGSFKKYIQICVDQNVKTALDAVAASFGLKAAQYKPIIQT